MLQKLLVWGLYSHIYDGVEFLALALASSQKLYLLVNLYNQRVIFIGVFFSVMLMCLLYNGSCNINGMSNFLQLFLLY